MSTIASQHQHHKEPAQPLMSPLLSPQDSLPLSPNLARDQLSPPPSLQDKEEEALAGPSNSSQDSWSPDSDPAKQGRKELVGWSWSAIMSLSGCFHHFVVNNSTLSIVTVIKRKLM